MQDLNSEQRLKVYHNASNCYLGYSRIGIDESVLSFIGFLAYCSRNTWESYTVFVVLISHKGGDKRSPISAVFILNR